MDSLVLFESVVYRKELPEYVDNLNKITNDDTPHINRGVELLLRNKRRTSEQPKTFQMKFGKMFSLFRREINIHLDFSLDCKKKESH